MHPCLLNPGQLLRCLLCSYLLVIDRHWAGIVVDYRFELAVGFVADRHRQAAVAELRAL